ncbi:MAG TPA: dTDP-4-dehydrorhamnose 3,5-epimerase [Candidatus Eisenbacteria bacterium]|nr:dTDP-4-dehydrorhamnose 3,5-epimerase [Candidatus Eisenbacteria bacterium]
MIFTETKLPGAYTIDPEKHADDRGFFARTWCKREFEARGLNDRLVQCNVSFSRRRGTIRGMHYQVAPYAEVKILRCTRGAIYDVIIDLRPDSRTYRRWIGVELSAANHRMIYVPEGFAHGFQTLEDDAEVIYQVSQFYTPGAERGVRYNDPAFGIQWPLEVTSLSEKDRTWPDFA